MKKKQKINKAVNSGEWILLGLTALFLCVLFAIRERPAPERGITVRTASSRLPADRSGAAETASDTPDSVSADAETASADAGSASGDVSGNASDVTESASGDMSDASDAPDNVPADAENASGIPSDAVTPSDTPAVTPSDDAAPAVTPSDSADERVNINTADLAQLCALPGIGDALAQRIIAYREEHGPFARPEDVMRVSGIGQGKFDAMKGLITT